MRSEKIMQLMSNKKTTTQPNKSQLEYALSCLPYLDKTDLKRVKKEINKRLRQLQTRKQQAFVKKHAVELGLLVSIIGIIVTISQCACR